MNSKNYKYILIFITATVLATIGLQLFWNIKSFKENKIQLIKDVQTAFDNSIEYYYVEDSKNDFVAIVGNDSLLSKDDFFDNLKLDTVFNKFPKTKSDSLAKKNSDNASTVELESIEFHEEHDEKVKANDVQTISYEELKSQKALRENPNEISSITILKGKKASDSISKIKNLVNKIIISMVRDSIEFNKLSKALDKELLRKNLDIKYSLQHFKADTIFQQFQKDSISELSLSAISESNFLPKNQKLQISFSDPTALILKRSFTEILLSLLLSLSVIFCLMYLLKTIQKQKKIDIIKNDLISNITHEFKTPITTISTAIEGIKNFNSMDDKEKTIRYLDISTQQLKKLEIMVEKLLETASLTTDKLNLNKEEVNIRNLIEANIEKHQMASQKELLFTSSHEFINCNIDVFHFENAISNLIDNAIKYGDENIQISVVQSEIQIEITVENDGIGIDKTHRDKIFDQFYRIPKGNVHDVKGFGIGLYYAKKIIEKHEGTLELIPNSSLTIFKITLPNVQ